MYGSCGFGQHALQNVVFGKTPRHVESAAENRLLSQILRLMGASGRRLMASR